MTNTVTHGACPHDCPDTCAWNVTVENGKAIILRGDKDHPFTHGGLCAKVNHYLEDRVYSPSRILHPLKRIGTKGDGRYEQVSWEEALDTISSRLNQIIAKDGPAAILPYSYMGAQGLIQSHAGDAFFSSLGASELVKTICGNTGDAGLAATIGLGTTGMHPEDIVHSDFIILWGTNTVVTNLHLWRFVLKARKKGAAVVVIDPIKTRTATQADWHIQPLPGTDAALALGIMNIIVTESLYDQDYVENYTLGFDQLKKRLVDYPPERVAKLTGLEVEEIIRLARTYAGSRAPLVRPFIGLEHHANGGMIFRTIACLPALVGAWQHKGGGLLRATAGLFFQAVNHEVLDTPRPEDQSHRSINMVQLGQVLNSKELDPPVRCLFVNSSNPAATIPNQNLIFEGLKREDLFTVVHEHFMTDTARYADYILPATTQVEQLDLNWSWGHTYLSLNQPAIDPVGESLSNTELFRRLARSMALEAPFLHTSDEDRIRTALDSKHPFFNGITYDALVEKGWMSLNLPDDFRPYAQGNFYTPSGKCEFYAEHLIEQGIDPLPTYIPADESPSGDPELAKKYPLMLLTGKSALHFLNSSYSSVPRNLQAEQEPHLTIHSDDAEQKGISDGDTVRVFNDRGEVTVRARLGEKIRPGVISLPSGWWASLSTDGSSANALTADGLSDMGGGSDFNDTLVEVEKLG